MDKEKEIEELEKVVKQALEPVEYGIGEVHYPTDKEIAESLYVKGYGNVKQAIKEFAEELKKKAKYKELKTQPNDNWNYGFNVIRKAVSEDDIDNLITELYGVNE